MEKLLLVDDDQGFCRDLETILLEHGWSVQICPDANACMPHLSQQKFDFILLDWNLPGTSGLEVCKWFRARAGKTPIIFVTGRDALDDKEAGLDAGGDDYITKPFEVRELLARIRTIRRRQADRPVVRPLQFKELTFKPLVREARCGDKSTQLRFIEANILEFFLTHRNRFFSAEQLFKELWPADTTASSEGVRVHMKHLREKLVEIGIDKLIINVKGHGYILRD